MTEQPTPPINRTTDSQSFDTVADLYHTYRPGYPADLIDDIITTSGIGPEGRILEIGCGAGKATRLFAQRGFSLLCLDPGQNLLELAAQYLNPYQQQVTFVQTRFEDWAAGQTTFDLVISAQAFHWLPEETRLPTIAGLLNRQGYMALFWNTSPDLPGPLGQALQRVYRERVPELAREKTLSQQLKQLYENRAQSVRESGYFEAVDVKTYPWSARYTTKTYLGLLNTYSDHLRLAPERREALFEGVAEVIEQHGGYFEKPYLAILNMARKRSRSG